MNDIVDGFSEIDLGWEKPCDESRRSIGELNGCKREIAILGDSNAQTFEIYSPERHSFSIQNRSIVDKARANLSSKIGPLMNKCSRIELDAYYEDREGDRAGVKAVFEKDHQGSNTEKIEKNDQPSSHQKIPDQK